MNVEQLTAKARTAIQGGWAIESIYNQEEIEWLLEEAERTKQIEATNENLRKVIDYYENFDVYYLDGDFIGKGKRMLEELEGVKNEGL